MLRILASRYEATWRLRDATSQLRDSRSQGIMDIPEIVNCSIQMFADETKLFRNVKSIDGCNIKKKRFKNTLSQWTNDWQKQPEVRLYNDN